ncbi:hypothetical protein SEEA0100_11166 [Salmonella enterica subsp. enterica serovar Anatum str. USDA 100]|nr:hypothetical protein SEEA0100_11166 [Salmonella enterica subsp. enterica serovar Anatum str. USDA 100]
MDIHPVHRQEMDNLTILKTTVTLKKVPVNVAVSQH